MTSAQIETVYREEAGRALATLVRLVGDFDLAGEALQDALATAADRWPATGVPRDPRAWLIHVGRSRAFDRIRRRAVSEDLQPELARRAVMLQQEADRPDDISGPEQDDDMLRLIFICCHPSFAADVQVALTLQTLCGLNVQQVARLAMISKDAMTRRLTRARQKISFGGLAYEVPERRTLNRRVGVVLAVINSVFTEGYASAGGDALMRIDLSREAIRLARLLDWLLPQRADVEGLLALMLLQDSRRASRQTSNGDIIMLEEQDRSRWDREQIAEGLRFAERALSRKGPPNAYVLQAGIAALHARASTFHAADWAQIASLYEMLMQVSPSPVVELNRVAAISMVEGPAIALDLLNSLAARDRLKHYDMLPAVRADLLRRLGRLDEALHAYREAYGATQLEPLRRFYARRIAEMTMG